MRESNRQLYYTSSGEEIRFRPSGAVRISGTITAVIRLAIVAAAVYWTAPAIEAYFLTRRLIGPARYLEEFHLSDTWLFAIFAAWSCLLIWWFLGSIYELAKTYLQNDRFLLRPDRLVVRRTKILGKELELKSYQPLELRLRPLDGALEAKQAGRSYVLTNGGTTEDREWLLDFLKQRYRFPETPVSTSIRESIATYIVERRPDQSVFITSSASSRIGCAVLAAATCIILLGLAIWLLSTGSGGGIIPLLFVFAVGFAGLCALNRRSVEASRGRLLVRWSSPVGKFLSRFVPSENAMMRMQFGEGEYTRNAGILRLRVVTQPKRQPSYKIIVCPLPDEMEQSLSAEEEALSDAADEPEDHEELEEDVHEESEGEDDETITIEGDAVLEFTGSTARPSAEYVLTLLSDATGFRKEP